MNILKMIPRPAPRENEQTKRAVPLIVLNVAAAVVLPIVLSSAPIVAPPLVDTGWDGTAYLHGIAVASVGNVHCYGPVR